MAVKKPFDSARLTGMEKVRSPFSVRIECVNTPSVGSAVLIASARKTGSSTGLEASNLPERNTTIDAFAVSTANGFKSNPYSPSKSSRAVASFEETSSLLRNPSRRNVPLPHVGSNSDWDGDQPAVSNT